MAFTKAICMNHVMSISIFAFFCVLHSFLVLFFIHLKLFHLICCFVELMKNYELELKIKKFTSIDYFFFEAFFAAGFFAAAFAML